MFASRVGFRQYEVDISAPLRLARAASEDEVLAAMQHLARELEGFVRNHPTQWFHFR
jgi:KDO2-lipid IV(A) lauroyltransferase